MPTSLATTASKEPTDGPSNLLRSVSPPFAADSQIAYGNLAVPGALTGWRGVGFLQENPRGHRVCANQNLDGTSFTKTKAFDGALFISVTVFGI